MPYLCTRVSPRRDNPYVRNAHFVQTPFVRIVRFFLIFYIKIRIVRDEPCGFLFYSIKYSRYFLCSQKNALSLHPQICSFVVYHNGSIQSSKPHHSRESWGFFSTGLQCIYVTLGTGTNVTFYELCKKPAQIALNFAL